MNTQTKTLLACMLLALAACSQRPSATMSAEQAAEAPPAAKPSAIGDTSQNALDWPGTYSGTLPCADCEGIATRISLGKDLRYTLSETYLGKSDKVMRSEGRFTWNQSGNIITLQGIATGVRSTQLHVGENQLIQLDMQGTKIEGELAERYVLKKAMADGLAGSQWRLVELAGAAVTGSPESHFLKFGDDGRVQAKAGCNNMIGSYQSDGPMRIRFTKMAMTMMACMDMSQEQALAAALEKADNYTLGENTLSLNKARMAALARFERIQ